MKENSVVYQTNSSRGVRALRPAIKQVTNPYLVYDYSNDVYMSHASPKNPTMNTSNMNDSSNYNNMSSYSKREPKTSIPNIAKPIFSLRYAISIIIKLKIY